MKMFKVAFGIPLLAILLTACSDESSETVSQKEEPTEKSTAVHTKEKGNKTAVKKESSPNTLQTKASTIKKAVNSKEADRDYLLNVMNGYQYIQVGDNQYIYYGINQEQNVFCMMEVNFDASGDYIENINFVDNASEEQIALLQNQIKEQQKQLSDLEQQQMEKELDDYYAQLEEDRQKEEEEKKQQEDEEAQAKADEEETEADSEDEVQTEIEPGQEEDTEAIEEEEPAEQTVSQEQAIQLVRNQQGISEDSPLLVAYDHVDDSGNYIIHVYESVVDNEETGEGHTATQGWYQVSPSDGLITDVTVDGY